MAKKKTESKVKAKEKQPLSFVDRIVKKAQKLAKEQQK